MLRTFHSTSWENGDLINTIAPLYTLRNPVSSSKRMGKRRIQDATKTGRLPSSWYYSSMSSGKAQGIIDLCFRKKWLVLKEIWQKSERTEFSMLPFLLTKLFRGSVKKYQFYVISIKWTTYHKMNSVTKTMLHYPSVFLEQNIIYWYFFIVFPPPFSCLTLQGTRILLSIYSVFVYRAKSRELLKWKSTRPICKSADSSVLS